VQWNSTTATFSLPAGTLFSDGTYRATRRAGSVSNAAGNPLAADAWVDFFVLAGDANRSRSVDLSDFSTLAANFNASGKAYSQGNFNYDARGAVELNDFSILAANFNKSIPASASVAAVVARPAAASSTTSVLSRFSSLGESYPLAVGLTWMGGAPGASGATDLLDCGFTALIIASIPA
jgi:hypothetical protein